jgi:hypothetical protein
MNGAGMGPAGSSTMGGSKAGEGGSGGSDAGGATGGGASCEQRWAEYYPLAMSARGCDPNAAMPECKFTVVVLDACGCSVPANGSSPDYAPARGLLSEYAEDCDFPEQCVGCPSTLDAACKENGSGSYQCEYQ